uniref:Ground-like domain-containing protein n=1 Tax=Parastrongyloides trichosuri TaxID=131310 RepID=A0A0N5A0F1_PARTI
MKVLAVSLAVILFIASTNAFLFGGGGGGGCGCGCMPSIPPPQMTCVSIPAMVIPIPSCPQPCASPCASPCGGKRKRRSALGKKATDEQCTDPSLRKLILTNLNDDSSKAQENVYEAAKSYFNETDDFIVSCGPSRDFYFTTSLDTYCVDGSDKLTCSIFKYD